MITDVINTRWENTVVVDKEISSQMEVYDLEIEGVHNYYANWCLVHNCDALRYLATVYQDMVNPKTEEVFEQDWSNYL